MGITHTYVRHDALVCAPRLIHVAACWVAFAVQCPWCSRSVLRCGCSGCDTATMGWLRLVGSLKLQVSFAEYCLFYRALLQKRPIILRSLLIVATPYPPRRGSTAVYTHYTTHCNTHCNTHLQHTLQHTLQHALQHALQHTLQYTRYVGVVAK